MFNATPKSPTIIQMAATLTAVAGLSYYGITWPMLILTLIFYFLYSGIGVSMMLHRYWTHKSFEFKSDKLKWVFTWFALMAGRGSIIGWVHVHREHHAYSDTEKDPHSPKTKSWRVFFPHMMNYASEIKRFLVRDLFNDVQLKINRYYMILIIAWMLILAAFGMEILIFAWALPIAITHLVLNAFTFYGHSGGYKNHSHRDYSANSIVFGILLWGEGWHNNHHKNPGRYSNREKWWEIDLVGNLIEVVKK